MAVVDLVGTVGLVLTLGMMLSPIPSLYQGYKEMKIQNMTLSYFIMGILQCIMWTCFGSKVNDFYIYIVNVIGLCLLWSYLNLFLYIKREGLIFLWANCSLLLALLVSYFLLDENIDLYLAVAIACVWQATTIPVMRKALENKDGSFVNIFLAYVSFANFFSWFSYGLLVKNYLISFQNFLSMTFCVLNIYIYHWTIGNLNQNNLSILILKVLMRISSGKENTDDKENRLVDITSIKQDFVEKACK